MLTTVVTPASFGLYPHLVIGAPDLCNLIHYARLYTIPTPVICLGDGYSKGVVTIWPEFLQFAAFFLLMVALLKISAAYLADRSPGSALASGLAWFVPA